MWLREGKLRNLTVEMLEQAFGRMKEDHSCRFHGISNLALKRGGYTVCANCFQLVWLGGLKKVVDMPAEVD